MNAQPPFTIRIRTENDQDMDWMVRPEEITFQQALEVISQVVQNPAVSAFDYDDHDEEGEKITVRSDEEMKVMFEMYFSMLSEEDMVRGLFPPLIVYPKVGKSAKKRNIHGLKIRTDTNKPSTKNASSTAQPRPLEYQQNQAASQVKPTNCKQPMGFQQSQAESRPVQDVMSSIEFRESDLEILELLGKGNGGFVQRVLHKPTGIIMAVKTMQLDVSEDVQKKIISELEILTKCNSCPTIIGFYKAFFVENVISICTEYMDGGSLDRYGQIPEPVLGRMAVAILQGLCYMWNLKILHRDIKPSNILVSTSGCVKLCDFGVSVQLTESIARTYVGTNAYMAPERIKGQEYSVPADIWSLGILLYELATGVYPYGNQDAELSPVKLFDRIILEPIPKLPAEVFSPDLIDFVASCTMREPNQRATVDYLSTHTFINRHNDGNQGVIASFIRSKMQKGS